MSISDFHLQESNGRAGVPLQLACCLIAFLFLSSPISCAQEYQPELVVQTGHTDSVGSLAATRDRRWLISGGHDFSIRLWNLKYGREEHIVGQHSREVNALAICPDGRCFVSGGQDQLLKLWELPSGRLLRTFAGHTAAINAVAITPDGGRIISAAGDTPYFENRAPDFSVRIWDIKTGRELYKLEGHRDRVISTTLSQDGHLLATASVDGMIRIWDIRRMSLLRVITELKDDASVKFLPDGRLVVMQDRKVRFRDISTGRLVKELTCNCRQEIFTLSLKESWLACADFSAVYVIDLVSGLQKASLDAPGNLVQSIITNADNTSLFVGYADGSIKEWNIATAKIQLDLRGSVSGVDVVAISKDARWFASGHRDGKVRLWNRESGMLVGILESNNKRVWALAFSPDSRLLATSGQDPAWEWPSGRKNDQSLNRPIYVWDLRTKQRIFSFRHDGTSKVEYLTFSPKGRLLAASGSGIVKIWDLTAGQLVATLSPASKVVSFGPDETWVATGAHDDALTYWKLPSGRIWERFPRVAWAYAMSPDARWLITTGWRKDFRVMDISSLRHGPENASSAYHKPLPASQVFRGHKDFVTDVIFRPHSKQVISSSFDGEIKLWDLASGHELYSLNGHRAAVESIACSEDGHWLISGGWDGAIRVWNIDRLKESVSLFAIRNSTDWLAVAHDGLFDGTAEAMQQVAWRRVEGEIVPLDNFFTDFFHPGLITDIFGTEPPHAEMDIAVALQIPSLRTMLAQGQAHLEVRKATAVVCFQEIPGVAVQFPPGAGPDIPSEVRGYRVQPGDPTCKYQKELPRTSTADALVAKLQQRKPKPFKTAWDGRKSVTPGSILHIFTVGIGQYSMKSGLDPIQYAAASARSIEALFRSDQAVNRSYRNIRIWPGLYDASATRQAIRQQLAEMANAMTENDVVLLYFAGHGLVRGEEMFYFVPFDGREEDIYHTGISTAMLAEALRNMPPRRIVMFIDACQSGGAVEALSKIGEAKARAEERRTAHHRETSKLGVGVYVIAATMPLSYAVQRASEPSLFSAVLLETLTEKKQSSTVRQMIEHMKESLPKKSESVLHFKQVPLTSSIGLDFPLI